MFETFEGRRLLSSSLANGVLTVTGTAGNDSIPAARAPAAYSPLPAPAAPIIYKNCEDIG